MKLVVISACTGKKAHKTPFQLTLADFKRSEYHIQRREKRLWGMRLRATDMYEGRQHLLLKEGVEAAKTTPDVDVDFRIVSAGYGFITSETMIAPYEATFSTMSKGEMAVWGEQLRLRPKLKEVLRGEYDLAIVALGDPYLTAANFQSIHRTAGPVIVFCSRAWWKKLKDTRGLKDGARERMQIIPLANAEAKRFREGLTSLKGELTRRILRHIVALPRPEQWIEDFASMRWDKALDELERLGPWRPEEPKQDEEE